MNTQAQEILTFIRGIYPNDAVTASTDFFNDLGMDSLDVVELFLELEDHLNIRIDAEPSVCRTVSKLVCFVFGPEASCV